jgi:hypothetical protein
MSVRDAVFVGTAKITCEQTLASVLLLPCFGLAACASLFPDGLTWGRFFRGCSEGQKTDFDVSFNQQYGTVVVVWLKTILHINAGGYGAWGWGLARVCGVPPFRVGAPTNPALWRWACSALPRAPRLGERALRLSALSERMGHIPLYHSVVCVRACARASASERVRMHVSE